ncbi:MAG: signal peptide peptidase SppA [SAR202 cluster bacterium]|nr:signal peptide peptidase SppA [SAR202 cluster bacterium]MQG56670.1 signal peptide peptidase SppA [SAR202 cluster bacterium]|tara:strand:+ start:1701 stop:2498 length:798 start_codon:yes stop_codon:yes gene_type:complete
MSIMLMNRLQQRIGVVEVFGSIGGAVRSPLMDRLLARIREDAQIKALVLDVDSPGGSATASEYIYRSVLRVAERKPVVASIRGVGASGSYMIACGAQRIVASKGAIIGSIGVISIRPMIEELLDRAGIDITVNKSGEFKDMGAPWREATAEEEEKMQALIDDTFGAFVSIVAEARGMTDSAVRALATGEVYRADKALELGLVDELGDLDRAIDLAAELAGVPRNLVFLRPQRSLRERLMGPLADSLVGAVVEQIDQRLWQNKVRL